jgi:hypothetical protein
MQERQLYCWICLKRGKQMPATMWNGYGEGVCSKTCAEEHNGKILADWKEICQLGAEIDTLSRYIENNSQ